MHGNHWFMSVTVYRLWRGVEPAGTASTGPLAGRS
jgi:hypothetical protein